MISGDRRNQNHRGGLAYEFGVHEYRHERGECAWAACELRAHELLACGFGEHAPRERAWLACGFEECAPREREWEARDERVGCAPGELHEAKARGFAQHAFPQHGEREGRSDHLSSFCDGARMLQ